MGPTYGLLRNLLAPASPKDKSFKEIVDTLKAHFEPKLLVIAERFHFHRRNQNSVESVAMYVAELRRLATHCAFEAYFSIWRKRYVIVSSAVCAARVYSETTAV